MKLADLKLDGRGNPKVAELTDRYKPILAGYVDELMTIIVKGRKGQAELSFTELRTGKDKLEFLKAVIWGCEKMPKGIHEVVERMLPSHPEWSNDWKLKKRIRTMGGSHSMLSRSLVVSTRDGIKRPSIYHIAYPNRYDAARLEAACRNAVDGQIKAFLSMEMKRGTAKRGWHVDHRPPWEFKRIKQGWLDKIGRQPKIEADEHGEPAFNHHDERSFAEFHQEKALLQCIPPKRHRKKTSKRIRKGKKKDGK